MRGARLADEIAALPRRLDTVVGEFGTALSGGQAQRLSLARALLRDAPVLILDEATSHVDPRSEELIAETIASLAGEDRRSRDALAAPGRTCPPRRRHRQYEPTPDRVRDRRRRDEP